jgi:glycosyltransferase involved in cell wall biosynthesis
VKKLAIITTHPIQYNAPLFKLLHQRGNIEIKVFYTWGEEVLQKKFDPGFNKNIEWDIPLLDGYEYKFVENIAKDKGSYHFRGIDNPSLNKEIESWGADAILVYGWSFKSHLKVMRYFKGKIPVLFRGDSTLLQQQGKLKTLFRKIFLSWVYKYVDTALYVGTHNKAYFKNCGLKENQLHFAPHAIDNARFQTTNENEGWAINFKKTNSIPDDHLIFMFAGKLEEKKNVGLLLSAFSTIPVTKTALVIVGNGPLEQELKATYLKGTNIYFSDFQNQKNMPAVYQLADVFVLPSKGPSETWGLAINEAMAAGKAILASDACAAAIDLIKPGANGYIFKSDVMEDAVNKIKLLGNSKVQLAAFGKASAAIIESWSYEKICTAIESTVNSE